MQEYNHIKPFQALKLNKMFFQTHLIIKWSSSEFEIELLLSFLYWVLLGLSIDSSSCKITPVLLR